MVLIFWCFFPPFHLHKLCPLQNADGSTGKVSVSKAKSDFPTTNHSDKNVAESPKGKPDVGSQSKNDAHVQTNKLLVEKDEKGMSCQVFFVVSRWLINGSCPLFSESQITQTSKSKALLNKPMILGFHECSACMLLILSWTIYPCICFLFFLTL